MKTRQRQKFSLSIGDVARRTGLTTSALRFYEDKALIGSLRTPGNQRCYIRDVSRVTRVGCHRLHLTGLRRTSWS